jgi:hypothetical protein
MTKRVRSEASIHGIDMVLGRVPSLFAACSLLLAACGGSGSVEDGTQGRTMSLNMRSEVNAGRLELRVDINLDGNPDLWELFDVYDSEGSHILDEAAIASQSGEDLRLVERRIDTNLDTLVDIVRFYNGRQQLERELLDIDFDGVLDYTNIYRNGILAERQADVDGDQVPEEVRFYRGGNLARIESDVDGDGRLEFYEYFRDNELTHYGIDRDGDGTVDEWTRRQGTMARSSRLVGPAATPTAADGVTAPGEGGVESGSETAPPPALEGSGEQVVPVVQDEIATPAVEDGPPAVEDGPPAVEDGPPAVEDEPPAVEDGPPPAAELAPAAESGPAEGSSTP